MQEGRAKLIEKQLGQRAVIQTNDSYKNKIDTVFVDRRNNATSSETKKRFATLDFEFSDNSDNYNSRLNSNNGKYLVICCDGNASFYEIGMLQTALDNGFSVLGWNYPGFAQSTVFFF